MVSWRRFPSCRPGETVKEDKPEEIRGESSEAEEQAPSGKLLRQAQDKPFRLRSRAFKVAKKAMMDTSGFARAPMGQADDARFISEKGYEMAFDK